MPGLALVPGRVHWQGLYLTNELVGGPWVALGLENLLHLVQLGLVLALSIPLGKLYIGLGGHCAPRW